MNTERVMRQKHDKVLVEKGPRGAKWRTFTVPFDEKLKKKKKFKKIIKEGKVRSLMTSVRDESVRHWRFDQVVFLPSFIGIFTSTIFPTYGSQYLALS